MTICYFGFYSPHYSRNLTIIKGLKANGLSVVECNGGARKYYGLKYFSLLLKFAKFLKVTDVVMVGFPGHLDVPLAWFLCKIFNKKLIFDAFISQYNTQIEDRQSTSKDSLTAKYLYWLDKISCILADNVVLDTNAQANYFENKFGVRINKIIRIWAGTNTDLFCPKRVKSSGKFTVGYHGSYLPLHGMEYIFEAAAKLKSINFKIVGDGLRYSHYQEVYSRLDISNVEFLPWIPYKELPDFINSVDIYLGGPFGLNKKAQLVIPNKVFEAMACEKTVIVGDNKAMRELLTNGKNCLLVPPGNAEAIAQSIVYLKNHPKKTAIIASNAYKLTREKLTPLKVVQPLITVLKQYEQNK